MPDPGIRIHLREIASWKALRTNERQALLAAIARIDALEAALREIIEADEMPGANYALPAAIAKGALDA